MRLVTLPPSVFWRLADGAGVDLLSSVASGVGSCTLSWSELMDASSLSRVNLFPQHWWEGGPYLDSCFTLPLALRFLFALTGTGARVADLRGEDAVPLDSPRVFLRSFNMRVWMHDAGTPGPGKPVSKSFAQVHASIRKRTQSF